MVLVKKGFTVVRWCCMVWILMSPRRSGHMSFSCFAISEIAGVNLWLECGGWQVVKGGSCVMHDDQLSTTCGLQFLSLSLSPPPGHWVGPMVILWQSVKVANSGTWETTLWKGEAHKISHPIHSPNPLDVPTPSLPQAQTQQVCHISPEICWLLHNDIMVRLYRRIMGRSCTICSHYIMPQNLSKS